MTTGDLRFADVLETEAIGGEVRAKLGNATEARGFLANAPVYGVDGFVSRPNPPSENGDAAQAMYFIDGNQSIVVGTRDNRDVDKVGELGEGDRAIITDGEARVLVKREGDAVYILTKNQSTGKTMIFEINGVDGVIQAFNGSSYISMTGDSIQLSAGDGSGSAMITVNAAGIHFLGKSFNCGMGGGHFGYILPPAPPVPGVAPTAPAFSVVVGPSGVTGIASSKWTMTV